MYSLDYGVNWNRSEIAISAGNGANLPHGVMADANWVHIIAEPGAGTYARGPARAAPLADTAQALKHTAKIPRRFSGLDSVVPKLRCDESSLFIKNDCTFATLLASLGVIIRRSGRTARGSDFGVPDLTA